MTRHFWVVMAMVLASCAMIRDENVMANGPVPLFVSIVPQEYFVKRIGGDLVRVSVMVRPGASPATYEPRPAQMVALSRAKAYFAIGVPFEAFWLKKIAASNPALRMVHTETGIEKVPINPERPKGIRDPHIWLSPPLVMVQAKNILRALVEIDPSNVSRYEANYKHFMTELTELDGVLREIFEGKGDHVRFMVFHPAWGYFARAYGLTMVPVEHEGKDPKPAALRQLIKKAREKEVKVVFVQPEFSTKSAETIARAIGGEVVLANPLAPDWAANLKEVGTKFKSALR